MLSALQTLQIDEIARLVLGASLAYASVALVAIVQQKQTRAARIARRFASVQG